MDDFLPLTNLYNEIIDKINYQDNGWWHVRLEPYKYPKMKRILYSNILNFHSEAIQKSINQNEVRLIIW